MRVFPSLLSSRFEKIVKHITVVLVSILDLVWDPIFPLWAASFTVEVSDSESKWIARVHLRRLRATQMASSIMEFSTEEVKENIKLQLKVMMGDVQDICLSNRPAIRYHKVIRQLLPLASCTLISSCLNDICKAASIEVICSAIFPK